MAFFASLVSFRYPYPIPLKVFSVLMMVTFSVELTVLIMLRWFHVKNDQWLYNLFLPVEYCFYGVYFYQILRGKIIRTLLIVFIFVFPVFEWGTTFLVFKLKGWNSYQAIAGNLFIVLFCVSYYYELFISPEYPEMKKNQDFWIVTGLMIFYSCNLPFVGALDYLAYHAENLADIFGEILRYLAMLMYSLITYAYLCRIPIQRSRLF